MTMLKLSAAMCLLALVVSTGAAGDEWQAIAGYETKMLVVSKGKAGAPVVSKGDKVTVHATGTVKETNKKFWSTKDAGQQPFTYDAGVGHMISGWDQGCLGMAVGDVRKLDIPANEGYGAQGMPAWNIPKNGGLLFTIEVLSINGAKEEL